MLTAEDIWERSAGPQNLCTLQGALYRMVENQEQIATRDLVGGDLQKQALLENMLESSKPAVLPGTEHLDYLLATPWRYPPLRHGSRYGSKTEPALFYGALSLPTTLAESAYYRWVFYFDMTEPPAELSSQHTMFQADYYSEKALALQRKPFTRYRSALLSKYDYRLTQALGTLLREAGVQLFYYPSARDPGDGDNIALLSAAALTSDSAYNRRAWLCSTRHDEVIYSYRGKPGAVYQFDLQDFLHKGRFPAPA